MSDASASPLARLDQAGVLLSPVFHGATPKGRIAFRGEMALKFAKSVESEKRPPEIKADQVFIAAQGERIEFFACYVDSLAHLPLVADLLADTIASTAKCFVFAGNIDILKKYRVDLACQPWFVLPLDEGTVYNELLDLFYLEKGDLKKRDTGGKLDALADGAAKFAGRFQEIAFDDALATMGAVKVYENRPV